MRSLILIQCIGPYEKMQELYNLSIAFMEDSSESVGGDCSTASCSSHVGLRTSKSILEVKYCVVDL